MVAPPIVFVCYSRKDDAVLTRLREVLAPFEARGELRLWYDLQMVPATDVDAKIQSVIHEASVAVLLVSNDMLASAYVQQK